ncbi:MAG: type I methionyl aminopeptidase [Actinomycetota bacterium]|nr:type I methionyl aminopeptidase [Actinomycetota bacterium]
MITIKNQAEFERMALAGRAVAAVLRGVREAAAPGVSTKELDAVAAAIIKEHGCRPSFLGYHGYPAHICTSPNHVIVHGIPDGYRLQEGDILSVDAGAIYEGFHGDAAVTFPIGEVDPEVEKLVRVAEEALWAAIAHVRQGGRLGDIGHAVQTVAEGAGFSVVREYVGHGIGRQMHEEPQVPNYGQPGKGMKLRTGMAICIEPMVNMGGSQTRLLEDEWTVVTADGSRSAHFEHTVALTEAGPLVTTAGKDEDLVR